MDYDITDIHQLTDKFMAGKTTRKEEDSLYEFFRTHEVPEDLKDVQRLFKYFDDGMPIASTPVRSVKSHQRRTMTYSLLAIAASVVVTVMMVMPHKQHDAATLTATATSAESPSETMPDTVNRTKADTIQVVYPAKNRSGKPHRYNRYHYSPAPMKPLMAQASIDDSIKEEGKRLVEAKLKAIETEQSALFEKFGMIAATQDSIITDMANVGYEDEEVY